MSDLLFVSLCFLPLIAYLVLQYRFESKQNSISSKEEKYKSYIIKKHSGIEHKRASNSQQVVF